MRKRARLLLVAAVLLSAGQVTAQERPTQSGSTVASCGDERTVVAMAQTLGVNLFLNRWNAWVFDWNFARVDFESWSRNLELGWQWDESQFGVNMFAHPYHGSLYFAASRANCLTYWEAVPVTFFGSWTWEYFGERFRPSLNDFWMTGFGGMVLGEIVHRASAAIIDQEAVGGERIAREVAATLVNPVGGLNRLLRGQWNDRGVNPPDRIPGSYGLVAGVGARRVERVDSPDRASFSPTLLLEVELGDTFDTEYAAPFDVVRLLAQVSPDGGGLNLLRALGRLYRWELTDRDARHRHQIELNQRFDYAHNGVYRYGEQSFEAGLRSRWRTGPGDFGLSTRLAGDVTMLGAIDALDAAAGDRTIDYGPGLGAIIEVSLEHQGTRYVSLYNRVRYLWTVSGAPANHSLLFSGIDISVPLTDRLGLGAYLSADARRSDYRDVRDEARSYLESRFYVTWSLSGGEESGGR